MLDVFRRARRTHKRRANPESRYAHELDVLEHAIESDEKDELLLQCAIDALQNHRKGDTLEIIFENQSSVQ